MSPGAEVRGRQNEDFTHSILHHYYDCYRHPTAHQQSAAERHQSIINVLTLSSDQARLTVLQFSSVLAYICNSTRSTYVLQRYIFTYYGHGRLNRLLFTKLDLREDLLLESYIKNVIGKNVHVGLACYLLKYIILPFHRFESKKLILI